MKNTCFFQLQEVILFVVDSRPQLTAKIICGMILQASNCAVADPNSDYEIEVDYPDSGIVAPPKPQAGNSTEKQTYRVLHLTDFHYDPKYKAGSNAQCEEPTCCRGVICSLYLGWILT